MICPECEYPHCVCISYVETKIGVAEEYVCPHCGCRFLNPHIRMVI